MKLEKYLVTTSRNGRTWKTIWDPSEPVHLDLPKSWVLVHDNSGIYARIYGEAQGATGEKKEQKSVRITHEMIESGKEVLLKHSQGVVDQSPTIHLKVQKMLPIRAAYLGSEHTDKNLGGAQLFASFGVRKYLLDYQPFRDAFVGYVRRKPVFAFITGGAEGTKVKALLDGVKIKLKGQSARPLIPGSPVSVTQEQLAEVMIIRGTHWWRIHNVAVPKGLTPDEIDDSLLDPESVWFKRILKGTLILFLLMSTTFLVMPKPEEKPEEPKPPEVMKITLRRPKKVDIPAVENTLSGSVDDRKAIEPTPSEQASAQKSEVKAKPAEPQPKVAEAEKGEKGKQAKVEKEAQAARLTEKKEKAAAAAVAKKAAEEKHAAAVAAKAAAAEQKRAANEAAKAAAAEKRAAAEAARAEAQRQRAAARAEAQRQREEAKRAAAAKAAAANAAATAQMLKDSMGALSGGSVVGTGNAEGAKNAGDEVFDGKGADLSPTVIKPGYTGRSSRVATMGGGSAPKSGNGVGSVDYGMGSNKHVNTEGRSLISVDPAGSTVDTGLTRAEVGMVIHAHMSDVRYCYDAARLRRAGMEGRVVIAFTINPQGLVKSGARVESSTVDDSILEQCVLGKLMRFKFPKPRGGVEVGVSYPFLFKLLGKE